MSRGGEENLLQRHSVMVIRVSKATVCFENGPGMSLARNDDDMIIGGLAEEGAWLTTIHSVLAVYNTSSFSLTK